LFALCAVIVLAAIVGALVVFPTRYKCNGDDLTFTTSQAFAEQTCPTGVTGPVVADHRLAPRAGVLVIAFISVAWLLRLATEDVDEPGIDG
jgi:hypothetical protein